MKVMGFVPEDQDVPVFKRFLDVIFQNFSAVLLAKVSYGDNVIVYSRGNATYQYRLSLRNNSQDMMKCSLAGRIRLINIPQTHLILYMTA